MWFNIPLSLSFINTSMKLADLYESINDNGIFKAVFIVGIPGAGKTFVSQKIVGGDIQPRVINTDNYFEFLTKKVGIDANKESWNVFGERSKQLAKEQLGFYINGMLPLIIDGTSANLPNLLRRIGILEGLGYDIGVVHIDTNIDTAIQRAAERDRQVEPDFIRHVFEKSRPNIDYIKNKVDVFMKIDNNDGELNDDVLLKAFRKMLNFYSSPIKNPVGNERVKQMREAGQSYLSDDPDMEYINKLVDSWYRG